MSSLKGMAQLKNFLNFLLELGLGFAGLEVQNMSWARLGSENLSMSQALAWLELKKLGSVLPETAPVPFPPFWSLHFSPIVSTGLHCTEWSLQALVTLSGKLAEIW